MSNIVVSGNYAYTADSNSGDVYVVDVADPTDPTLANTINNGDYSFEALAMSGHYIYATSYENGNLYVLDTSDPTNPTSVAAVPVAGTLRMLTISGNYVYATTSINSNIYAVDISNPASPAVVGMVATPAYVLDNIAASGNYVYAVDYDSDSLYAINATNPADPVLVSATDIGIEDPSIAASGNYVYAAGSSSNIAIVDTANPASPVLQQPPVALLVNGGVRVKSGTDNTNSFQVQDAENNTLLDADTTHDSLIVQGAMAEASADIPAS